jgi:hypothetical protein
METRHDDITGRNEQKVNKDISHIADVCAANSTANKKGYRNPDLSASDLFCRLYRLLLIRSKGTKIYVNTCVCIY